MQFERITKHQRNRLKKGIVNQLRDVSRGLFDGNGNAKFEITLEMVEQCVFDGLNTNTDKNKV